MVNILLLVPMYHMQES